MASSSSIQGWTLGSASTYSAAALSAHLAQLKAFSPHTTICPQVGLGSMSVWLRPNLLIMTCCCRA